MCGWGTCGHTSPNAGAKRGAVARLPHAQPARPPAHATRTVPMMGLSVSSILRRFEDSQHPILCNSGINSTWEHVPHDTVSTVPGGAAAYVPVRFSDEQEYRRFPVDSFKMMGWEKTKKKIRADALTFRMTADEGGHGRTREEGESNNQHQQHPKPVGAAGACTAPGVREGYQAGGHDASLLHMRGDPEAMASTFARAILLVDSLLAEGTLTPRQARKLRFLCMWQKPPLAVLVGVRAREGRARRGDGGRQGEFGVMCPSIEYRACMPDNLNNKTRIWPQRENRLSRSMLACLSWRVYFLCVWVNVYLVCVCCVYVLYACM